MNPPTDEFGGVAVADRDEFGGVAVANPDEFGGVPVAATPAAAPPSFFASVQPPPNAADNEERAARDWQSQVALQGEMQRLHPQPPELTTDARPWYDRTWDDFRSSHLGHVLLGPTAEEQHAIDSGGIYGPPGGDPGIVPLALSAPGLMMPGEVALAKGAPKVAKVAGTVLQSWFLANNLKNQPERIAEMNRKFQHGDTKGAYHDILMDAVDTTMAAGAGHGAYEQMGRPFASLESHLGGMLDETEAEARWGAIEPAAIAGGAPREPWLDAMVRQGMQPAPAINQPAAPAVDSPLWQPDQFARANAINEPAVPGLPGYSGVPRPPGPVVPETPAEPERNLTISEEIRQKGAKTVRQIQALYPKAELTKEQARVFRNEAWGTVPQPVQGPPKPWEEFNGGADEAPAQTPSPSEETENVPGTNIGSNEGKASEMPVAAGESPAPEQSVPAEAATEEDPGANWMPADPAPERTQTLVSERRKKGNVMPLAEFKVAQTGDGGWHYSLQLNANETGYGTPFVGPFPSKEIAINAGLMDASRWLAGQDKSARTESPTFSKDLERIRGVLKPLLDKTVQKTPAPWETGTAAKKPQERERATDAVKPVAPEPTARPVKSNAPAPTAKPAEAPAAAAAKVEAHVSDVAATEGQRPAKEVKAELADKLQKIIDKIPAGTGQVEFDDPHTERGKRKFSGRIREEDGSVKHALSAREVSGGNWRIFKSEISGKDGTLKETDVAQASDLKTAKSAMEGSLRELQAGRDPAKAEKITLQIPGDGKFTVYRTRAALTEVLARVQRLDTRPGKPVTIERGGESATGPFALTEEQWLNPETIGHLEKEIAKPQGAEKRHQLQTALWQAKQLQGLDAGQRPVLAPEKSVSEVWQDNYTDALGKMKARGGESNTSILRDIARSGRMAGRNPGAIIEDFKDAGVKAHNAEYAVNNEFRDVTPRGAGAKIRPARPAAPGATPAAPAPTPPQVSALRQQLTRWQAATAPQTLGSEARYVGNLVRMLNAKMANELLRADEALSPFRAHFDETPLPRDYTFDPNQPLPHNLAFIDAYERGAVGGLPAIEQRAAEEFARQNADWLNRVHALGTGVLKTFYENYFPHLWDDPARARDVIASALAKRPLEGSKSFLKQRTHELFMAGLEAGLKPVHDNPVDLWMLKKREVERYITAREFINDAKAQGILKFVHSLTKAPDGYSRVNDAAFTSWGPPHVTIKEYFDAHQRAGLLDLLNCIGAGQKRMANLPHRGALGLAYPPPIKQNLLKAGTTESTAWHELGHQMDWAYPDLRDRLDMRGNSDMAKQLRALVDLRGEGQQVSASRQKYFRETEEKIAEIFKAYIHAPELFQKTAPKVWDEFNSWLGDHPDIRDRVDAISPRLTYGSESTNLPLGGRLKLGDWMLPDAAARVVNNYLSPGLNPHLFYRSARELGNFLNGAQLGLSAFHLGFTSLDAATSRLAVAIEDASHGQLLRALRTAASVPAAPITNIRTGVDVRRAVLGDSYQKRGLGYLADQVIRRIVPATYDDAQVKELAKALEAGGGRVGQDRFWRTEFTRRMGRAFAEERNNWAFMEGSDLRTMLNAPLSLWEQAMRPIMEYVVPRQKLGVFADMAQREVERLGANADPADVRERMRLAWDSVDNRMGQLVYDNLFYNRAVKDLALLSFRAYGWQLGKYREGIGAALDTARAGKALVTGQRPDVSHRMAYVMALPMVVGTLGALATAMMTGRRPKGIDYFMPPTGEKDALGNDVRLNFPSYMKDVLSYERYPGTSFAHSLNPLISSMFDLYQNKDFYDVQIHNPDDPLWNPKTWPDVAKFAAKQFVPFSVSGAAKLREDASPVAKQVLPFFGITRVPSRMTMTPAQELSGDIMGASMGSEPMTQDQFDRKQIIRGAVQGIKTGNAAKTSALGAAIASGKINPDAMETLMTRMKFTPLQFQVFHMDPTDSLRVWRVANPQERAQLKFIIIQHIQNSKTLTVPVQQKMIAELNQR